MADDAIRAALDAATEAFCRYPDGLKCVPEPWCEYCQAGAAAAIAAFLRALPMPNNNSGGWSCALVADAVERAAQEDKA